MPSILFVCTANRFRSPLAEAFFRAQLLKRGLEERWNIESAGTWAVANLPPISEALVIAQKHSLDISKHLSKSINDLNLQNYDLILVMETGHKEALINEFPDSQEKILLLSEISTPVAYSIPDPFMSSESPQKIAAEIYDLIDFSSDWIIEKFAAL